MIKPGQIFEDNHGCQYKVLHLAQMEDQATLEMVVYQSLATQKVWVHTRGRFLVRPDGKRRFTQVSK